MTPSAFRPSLTVVLIAPSAGEAVSGCAARARARGDVREILQALGPFRSLAPEVLRAARCAAGDFVLVLTPDAVLPEHGWRVLTQAAADPGLGAVRLASAGLAGDPAWRGRRARSHERNIESARFAHFIAVGAMSIRRDLLVRCLEEVGEGAGEDWWREVVRRVLKAGRVGRAPTMVARPRRLPAEPATPGFAAPRNGARPPLLVLGQIEASTSLYFDFLEDRPETPVRFRPLTGLAVDAPHLAGAKVVVLVRELHRFWDEGVIELLSSVGVPYVYFTDDNFLALASEGAAPRFYTQARMRRALAGASEVWCSTDALARAYAQLHPRVRVWGPALDPVLAGAPPRATNPLCVGIAGGEFRSAGLAGAPLERLRTITRTQPLRIITTKAAAHVLGESWPEAEIAVLPVERSFRQFVRSWRRENIDVLLHPTGATANAPFKCPTAVILAGYLGAVPVVADEPAYAGWSEREGVVRLGPNAEGLAKAASNADDFVWREDMARRLNSSLAERFCGEERVPMLLAALGGSPQAPETSVREVMASRRFRRRRAELSFLHAARWVSRLARQG